MRDIAYSCLVSLIGLLVIMRAVRVVLLSLPFLIMASATDILVFS